MGNSLLNTGPYLETSLATSLSFLSLWHESQKLPLTPRPNPNESQAFFRASLLLSYSDVRLVRRMFQGSVQPSI